MLDMNSLKRKFSIPDVTPEVLAIVIKGEATDADTTGISARGFNIEDPQSFDGVTVFIQKDAELGGAGQIAMQTDDRTCVICSFQPFSDSDSFAENIDQQGFLPGFDTALSVLRDTVFNALFSAEDSSGAADSVKEAVKEFGVHVTGMAKAIPREAFKMDPSFVQLSGEAREQVAEATSVDLNAISGVALSGGSGEASEALGGSDHQEGAGSDAADSGAEAIEVQIGDETVKLSAIQVAALKALADDGDEEDASSEEAAAPEGASAEADAEETTEGDEGEAEAEPAEAASEAGDGDSDSGSEEGDNTATIKALLGEFKNDIIKQIEGVNGKVDELGERVIEAEQIAKSADEAVSGATGVSANGDRDKTKPKSASTIPLHDSAMVSLKLRHAQSK